MEDAECTELDLDNTTASFFGIYDGHGGKRHETKKSSPPTKRLTFLNV
jgi:serine/threonine protein phosphatase PrpC